MDLNTSSHKLDYVPNMITHGLPIRRLGWTLLAFSLAWSPAAAKRLKNSQ